MLKNSLMNTFLPAVEDEARQQASDRFSGIYISPGNTSKTSFAIATDDHPGLGLFNATTINGTPLQLIAESQGLGGANKTLSVRLYPTRLKTTATTVDKKGVYTSRMSFRATFEALRQSSGMGWCQTWESTDGNMYGGVGIEEFVLGILRERQCCVCEVEGAERKTSEKRLRQKGRKRHTLLCVIEILRRTRVYVYL